MSVNLVFEVDKAFTVMMPAIDKVASGVQKQASDGAPCMKDRLSNHVVNHQELPVSTVLNSEPTVQPKPD